MSTKTKRATPAKKPTKPINRHDGKNAARPTKAPAKKPANKPIPRKVSKKMQDSPQAQNPSQAPSCTEALLEAIHTTLKDLVAIETYCATKIAEKYEAPAVAAPVAAPVASVQPVLTSVPATPAPAQQSAAPAVPSARPGQGTIGGIVWDICDWLMQSGTAPTKDQVLAAIKQHSPTVNGQPVNELTASTQYSKWRSAQGLPRLPRGFGANKPATVPTAEEAAAQNNAPLGYPRAAVGPSLPALPVALPPAAPAPVAAPLPAPFVPPVTPPAAPSGNSLPPWLRPQG